MTLWYRSPSQANMLWILWSASLGWGASFVSCLVNRLLCIDSGCINYFYYIADPSWLLKDSYLLLAHKIKPCDLQSLPYRNKSLWNAALTDKNIMYKAPGKIFFKCSWTAYLKPGFLCPWSLSPLVKYSQKHHTLDCLKNQFRAI